MQTAAGARSLREDDQPRTRPGGRFERAAPAERRTVGAATPAERRTVVITGHPVPPRRRRSPAHQHPVRRRRSPTHEQIVARPDRLALWAFLLAVFLVFVGAATGHAAV